MNKERILALADLIEKQPHVNIAAEAGFNMENWTHDCGTPACIAGWAVAMQKGLTSGKEVVEADGSARAASFLGIDMGDAIDLFEPDTRSAKQRAMGVDRTELWSEITPAQAAATLRRLAETGEVKWETA